MRKAIRGIELGFLGLETRIWRRVIEKVVGVFRAKVRKSPRKPNLDGAEVWSRSVRLGRKDQTDQRVKSMIITAKKRMNGNRNGNGNGEEH